MIYMERFMKDIHNIQFPQKRKLKDFEADILESHKKLITS